MAEPKWTPGPWALTTSKPPGQWVISSRTVFGPGDLQLRDVGRYFGGSTTDPSEEGANARLIAAAPELYEALEYMIGRFRVQGMDPLMETGTQNFMTCEELLAKARGELPDG